MHSEIAADRGEAAAVGAEGHSLEGSVVAAQGELFSAGLRVPYLEQVLPARGEPPAVGTELYASDCPGQNAPRQRRLTRIHVPDVHFPSISCFPTACRGQALTVRAKGY